MDLENLRKEHQKEIEMIKTDQDSEQKNIITLLQRQNMSLESKCDKLQNQSKTFDSKIKEFTNIIESKNKHLVEKDHERIKLEEKYKKKIEELNNKISVLMSEKERLRHKIIRAHLKAQGDNDNSIEGMLKKLSKVILCMSLYTRKQAIYILHWRK
jgi:chromosome segregation ATPase